MRSQRRQSWGLLVSLLLLAVAVIECVLAVAIAPQSSGANIGLGLAILAAVFAAVAVGVSASARTDSAQLGPRVIARAIGVVALLVAGGLVLLVGVGILEEVGIW